MEKFEITKEQVLEIAETSNMATHIFLGLFPDAFKTKFTGWAKDIHEFNKEWIAYYENDILRYGLNTSGDWFESKSNANYNECESNRVATEQEVKTSLINEAKKRGFVKSASFNSLDGNTCNLLGTDFIFNRNILYASDDIKDILFDNGKWAEIIETITKEEAEKLLNKKII